MSKLRNYFDLDLNSTLLHAVLGAIVGYVSFVVNNPLYNLATAVVVLFLLNFSLKNVLKIKKKFSWWLGNGVIVYLLLWIIVWTIFYNYRLLG
jgi:hypothetical protein